jgi:hypothetical protein
MFKRMKTTFLAGLLLGFGCLSASAKIMVREAQYAAGVLVVTGKISEPYQRVSLDGRYQTRADQNREFRFRIRYLPSDCIVDLRSGPDREPLPIRNCTPVADNKKPSQAR